MKVLVKVSGPRIVQHAVHLRGEHFRVLQTALRGERIQLVVRHGGPEEIGEARREFVLPDGINARLLAAVLHFEEEIRARPARLSAPASCVLRRDRRVAPRGRRASAAVRRRRSPPAGDRLLRRKVRRICSAALRGLQRLGARFRAEQAIMQRQFFRRRTRRPSAATVRPATGTGAPSAAMDSRRKPARQPHLNLQRRRPSGAAAAASPAASATAPALRRRQSERRSSRRPLSATSVPMPSLRSTADRTS